MNFRSTKNLQFLEAFNFSSLTDVVMQLLIFFLLTFSFANIQGMNVTLPKSSSGQSPLNKTVNVSVSKDKLLYLNGKTIGKERLAADLRVILQKEAQQQVVVQADKTLQLQDVIDILDIVKSAGAPMFFIATESPRGGR